jgi:hypothetical protein
MLSGLCTHICYISAVARVTACIVEAVLRSWQRPECRAFVVKHVLEAASYLGCISEMVGRGGCRVVGRTCYRHVSNGSEVHITVLTA